MPINSIIKKANEIIREAKDLEKVEDKINRAAEIIASNRVKELEELHKHKDNEIKELQGMVQESEQRVYKLLKIINATKTPREMNEIRHIIYPGE